jgi:hypothetical protein
MKTTKPKTNSAKKSSKAKTIGTKKSSMPEVEPAFAPIVKAFAKDPAVTSGKMMSSVGLKVGGKIFAMMVRGEFVAKLPKERVDALVKVKQGKYFDPRRDGRLMKEWIALSGAEATWLGLAREAYRFVRSGKR